MNAEELKKRTKLFALRILKLVAALPNTVQGSRWWPVGESWNLGRLELPSCLSRTSRAEFIAKIGIVEEEADESAFWLELIIEGDFCKRSLFSHC